MRYLTRFTTLAAFLAAISGCASSSPSHPSVRAGRSPASEITLRDSANSPLSQYVIYQPGQLRYHLQISSVVQLAAGDSTHRVDSTQILGSLRVRFTTTSPREEIRAEVQPDSLSLTVGSGTSVLLPPSSLAVFRIDPRAGHITPDASSESTLCGQAGSSGSPLSGREVLPSVQPRNVNTWMDTSTSRTCRDSVLLLVTRIASYVRLQSPDSSQQVIRSSQVRVSGTGYQWGQKVNVTGDGTAVDTLRINGFPLRLQESTGSSLFRFQFHGPLKTQEFIQSTRSHMLLEH